MPPGPAQTCSATASPELEQKLLPQQISRAPSALAIAAVAPDIHPEACLPFSHAVPSLQIGHCKAGSAPPVTNLQGQFRGQSLTVPWRFGEGLGPPLSMPLGG